MPRLHKIHHRDGALTQTFAAQATHGGLAVLQTYGDPAIPDRRIEFPAGVLEWLAGCVREAAGGAEGPRIEGFNAGLEFAAVSARMQAQKMLDGDFPAMTGPAALLYLAGLLEPQSQPATGGVVVPLRRAGR